VFCHYVCLDVDFVARLLCAERGERYGFRNQAETYELLTNLIYGQ
jgi:hypothetical protein